jgi:hypothetical protein
MSWEATGALAEVLGALGVIVSLVYLAVQVRQNTKALRLDAAHNVMKASADVGWPLMDAEFSDRVGAALAGEIPQELGERMSVQAWFFNTLRIMESAHYQHEHGGLPPEVWRAWEEWWKIWIYMPGMASYWADRKAAFLPSFQATVDGWLSDTPPQMVRIGDAAAPSDVEDV